MKSPPLKLARGAVLPKATPSATVTLQAGSAPDHVSPCRFYHVVCLHFKIPQNVEIIILTDCIWLLFVPFLCNIKSTPLTDFPMHLPQQVVSTLIFHLCHLTTLTKNMIYTFVSLAAHSAFAFLLGLVYLCLDQISSDCLLLSCHYQCFCLPFQGATLQPHPLLLVR